MSLDPTRRKKPAVEMEPLAPGETNEVKIDDLKPKKSSLFGFVKAIFEK